MKNKIALIVASLAVMVAMSGTAMSGTAFIGFDSDPTITVNVLNTGTHLVIVDPGTSSLINLTINGTNYTRPDGTFDATQYNPCTKFYVTIDGAHSTTCVVPWTYASTHIFEVNYTHNQSAPNGDYTVSYEAPYNTIWGILKAKGEADVIAIPEFPTVALPVAAIIGLLFYFHNRKRK